MNLLYIFLFFLWRSNSIIGLFPFSFRYVTSLWLKKKTLFLRLEYEFTESPYQYEDADPRWVVINIFIIIIIALLFITCAKIILLFQVFIKSSFWFCKYSLQYILFSKEFSNWQGFRCRNIFITDLFPYSLTHIFTSISRKNILYRDNLVLIKY